MKTKIKKAAVLQTTAIRNKLHCKPSQKAAELSSLKLKIGHLLLFSKSDWQKFDLSLRQYIDLKAISYGRK
jgi:hypothetical protein